MRSRQTSSVFVVLSIILALLAAAFVAGAGPIAPLPASGPVPQEQACPVPGLNVAVLPLTANLTVGQSRQFEAVVYCGSLNVTDTANISWSVTGGIGNVYPATGKTTSFLAQAVGSGTVVATAEYQGESAQRGANVGVTGGAACNSPLNVQVNPHQANMKVGEAMLFAATVRCGPDDVTSVSTIAWRVGGGIGNVTPLIGPSTTFLAGAIGTGTVVANATYQTRLGEGSAAVVVTAGGNVTPAVVSTFPINGATNVPTNQPISISFNTPMDTAATQGAISASPAITGSFAWSGADTIVTWTPGAPLAAGTAYTVTVGSGAKSKTGAPVASPSNFTFTTATGGGSAPTVMLTAPTNNQQNVPVDSVIRLTFDMAMDPTATGGAVSASPAVSGGMYWTAGNTFLTWTPGSPLAYSSTYTVTVGIAAKSAAGVALATPYVWSFKTESAPVPPAPKVTGTTPANGATLVSLDTNVVVTFDIEMDRTATEGAVSLAPVAPGTFSWNTGGTQLTLDPTAALAPSTTYTITISTSAKSKAGAALAAAVTSQFGTTATPADTTPPVIVHTPVASWDEGKALPITAQVTDNVAVKNEFVSLNFRGAGAWGSEPPLEMKRVGTTDNYSATIDGAKVAGPSLEYYISAGDTAGNNATHPPGAPANAHKVTINKAGGGGGGSGGGGLTGGGLLLPLLAVLAVVVVGGLIAFMLLKRRKKARAETGKNEIPSGTGEPKT